jgi:hypothetical protein
VWRFAWRKTLANAGTSGSIMPLARANQNIVLLMYINAMPMRFNGKKQSFSQISEHIVTAA